MTPKSVALSSDSEDEDLLEAVRQSLQANDQWKVVRNRRKEKRFRVIGSPKEVKSGTVGGSPGGARSGFGRAPKGLTPTVSEKRTRGKEPCQCCSVGSLIEIDTDGVYGLNEQTPEWEELEFLVDSGASVTVVGQDTVQAVQASEPTQSRQYKLADGSYIPHKGNKTFGAVTDIGITKQITASVTDVDTPLLSVAQIVRAGSTVVFHRDGSYVQDEQGEKIPIEQKGGLFTLKVWVPRDQASHCPAGFQGQANGRP